MCSLPGADTSTGTAIKSSSPKRPDVTNKVVGGKTRRLWPMAAIVVVVAVSGAVVWAVWRSPQRIDLSTFGAFAVAVIVPVASLVVYLTKVRQAGETGRAGRSMKWLTPWPWWSRNSGPEQRWSGGCCSPDRSRCTGKDLPGRSPDRYRRPSSRGSSRRCRDCPRPSGDSSGADGCRTCTPSTAAWDPVGW